VREEYGRMRIGGVDLTEEAEEYKGWASWDGLKTQLAGQVRAKGFLLLFSQGWGRLEGQKVVEHPERKFQNPKSTDKSSLPEWRRNSDAGRRPWI